MRFQVPQFIDVEDKIFGPLTLKQFIYLAGGGGLSFLIYAVLKSLFLSLIPIVIVMSLAGTLAFYRVNGKPFINIMEFAFKYFFSKKLYIWKKEEVKAKPKKGEPIERTTGNYASIMVPKISDSKLKDLTWSLDIKESVYSNKNQR